MNKFLSLIKEKVVIFDGAMGTTIQDFNLSPNDYDGFEDCYEWLNISKLEIIKKIHSGFFEAGADVIETNTFGANEIVLQEFGLEDEAYNINLQAAKIAKECK